MRKIKKIIFKSIIIIFLFANLISSIYALRNISHECDDERCAICVIIKDNESSKIVPLTTFSKIKIINYNYEYEENKTIVFKEIIYESPITLKVKLLN